MPLSLQLNFTPNESKVQLLGGIIHLVLSQYFSLQSLSLRCLQSINPLPISDPSRLHFLNQISYSSPSIETHKTSLSTLHPTLWVALLTWLLRVILAQCSQMYLLESHLTHHFLTIFQEIGVEGDHKFNSSCEGIYDLGIGSRVGILIPAEGPHEQVTSHVRLGGRSRWI